MTIIEASLQSHIMAFSAEIGREESIVVNLVNLEGVSFEKEKLLLARQGQNDNRAGYVVEFFRISSILKNY